MNLLNEAEKILRKSGQSHLSVSDYDSSFFMHKDLNFLFPNALNFIGKRQKPDGSWGGIIEYPHDRILSTLGVIVNDKGKRLPKKCLDKAKFYLEKNLDKLQKSPYETIGFEWIFPLLLEKSGLTPPEKGRKYIRKIERQRAIKNKWLKNNLYSPNSLLVHSLESLGQKINLNSARKRQENNGAMAGSPSATAYYFELCKDKAALRFLKSVRRKFPLGGVPTIFPIEIFEINWLLENFSVAPKIKKLLRTASGKRKIEYLEASWKKKKGLSHSRSFSVECGDDSFLALKNIYRFTGKDPDLLSLKNFQESYGYRSFPYEYNPSVSTHAHLLSCILDLPTTKETKLAYNRTSELLSKLEKKNFWFDKWHISPFYPTSKIYISEIRRDHNLPKTLSWIINSQRSDGGWGYYDISTCEETAFALQAIYFAVENGVSVNNEVIKKGYAYIRRNYKSYKYPEMWIGKTLYSPLNVIDGYIISAIDMISSLKGKRRGSFYLGTRHSISGDSVMRSIKKNKRFNSVLKTVEIVADGFLRNEQKILLVKFLLWLFSIDDYIDRKGISRKRKLLFLDNLKKPSFQNPVAKSYMKLLDDISFYPLYKRYGTYFDKQLDRYLDSIKWEVKNSKAKPDAGQYLHHAKITMGFHVYSSLLIIIYNQILRPGDIKMIYKMTDYASFAARLANDKRSLEREKKEESLNYFELTNSDINSMDKKMNIYLKKCAVASKKIENKSLFIKQAIPKLSAFIVDFYSKTDFTAKN